MKHTNKPPKSHQANDAKAVTNVTKTTKNSAEKPIHGARNLAILGAVSVSLAVISTAISLYIYHATGDIYLDRSRPGFIFEDETFSDEASNSSTYSFPPEGEITRETLEDYLDELDQVITEIDDASQAFAADPLSDKSLGITVEQAPEPEENTTGNTTEN